MIKRENRKKLQTPQNNQISKFKQQQNQDLSTIMLTQPIRELKSLGKDQGVEIGLSKQFKLKHWKRNYQLSTKQKLMRKQLDLKN